MDEVKDFIFKKTGASQISSIDSIQELWSGYGKIERYQLKDAPYASVIVKRIEMPEEQKHPRGWDTDISHQRKLRSYQVEKHWYENYSKLCDHDCRVPHMISFRKFGNTLCLLLEDLDAAGYPVRKQQVSLEDMKTCLHWLASFHAIYLGNKPGGLWKVGTYWHLETRPDELKALQNKELKKAAPLIDQMLNQCEFQTFVHGDAKLANFCFSEDGKKVAAVDFQYIGGGCGIKDVAYFISSCLEERDCEKHEKELLDYYFESLKNMLQRYQPDLSFELIEKEWRDLYPVAWTDFTRFLLGWSPGHWKIHGYSKHMTKEVLKRLCP